ncbi:S8 family serine peptidase [Carnobacterium gallinarum]|uniref:S8 family serine peptidase n=1 Tax=Carnobacterium gallinarum TaxID=2749 RepID=UPI000690BE39|nr:S8 family serine peptidase [Carnobacterium gallinarum]
MGIFNNKKRQKRRTWGLLIILLLSTNFSTFSSFAFAEDKIETILPTNYNQLLAAQQNQETAINDLNKKAFDENVKAQLASRGFDVSQLNENSFDENQEIRLIVQLDKEAAVKQVAAPTGSKSSIAAIDTATDSVIDTQETIKNDIEKLTGNKSPRAFGYLINGFSIDAKYKDVDKIRAMKGVQSVTAAKVYYPTSIDANQLANIQQVWQKRKLKGEGMVVSIIDSGIDPTHKDLRLSDNTKEKIPLSVGQTNAKKLGYGQAFNRKVPFGYNYADNNEEIVDKNPATAMHGMHVAGIVAANGIGEDPTKAVLGVAPEAQLLAMKVFSNNTRLATALDDDIIAAIEDSVKLGADILNMSLGSVSGTVDPNSPEQLVIKQAAEAGVLSVISAGNSSLSTTDNPNVNPQNKLGTIDTGTLGSPGVTTEALTVASSENTYITSQGLLVQLINADGTKTPYKMTTSTSPSGAIVVSNGTTADTALLSQPTDLVAVGPGQQSDYQNKDVKDKIVLIQRGLISFSDKQRFAKENGARAAFIYNNVPDSPPNNMQLNDPTYLTLSLTKEDGDALVKLAQETTQQQFSFDVSSYQFANPKSGKMSDFSSWGLTPDLEFKPEISAPGGNIYSTVNNNSYQTKSGTSMSSPFVAGAQALVYQSLKKSHPTLSGIELTRFAKLSVMNTALPMLDKNNNDVLISPRRQGAGQIKLDKALDNTTSLTDSTDNDGALALKQIGQQTTMSVNLKNNGTKPATYQFTDFNGVYTEAKTATAEVYATKIAGANLTPTQKEIILQPGETKTVEISLSLPDSFAKQQFVEGYIGFTSDSQPNLTMPFVGFYGDYSLAPVIDAPVYDKASLLNFGYFTDKNNTFLGLQNKTINPDLVAISPNQDGRKDQAKPTLNFLRNAKSVTYEVVDASNKVIRRLNEDKRLRKDTFNSKIGQYSSHTVADANWDGTVYNTKTGKNEVVADGQYQLKVTAQADLEKATPQEMYLPIKVDTTKPTISDIAFDESGTKLKLKLTDLLSGVDLRSIAVSINGKIETYDVSQQEAESVSIPLKDSQKPTSGKNQVEVLISDYAGNYGSSNQYVQAGSDAPIALFNLSDNQIITTNTSDFSATNQTMTIRGFGPKIIYINGLEVQSPDGFFNFELPITSDTQEILFSTDAQQQTILKKVPVRVYITKPELTISNPDQAVSTTEKTSYPLIGKTGVTTKKLEVSQTSDAKKVDLTALIEADGQFKTDIPLLHGQNMISITATDEYGNQKTEKVLITTSGYQQTPSLVLDTINVNSLTLVGVGNPNYDPATETYKVKGRLREKVDRFTINQQDVPYDSETLTFSYPVKLKQGKNSVAFLVQSNELNNGEPLVNEGYYVIVDTILPTLQMDNLTVDDAGNYSIYTNKNPVRLSGLISDNFSGYKLFVNNDNVQTAINYTIFNEKFFEGKEAAPFEYDVPVTDGANYLQVGLTDSLGNTTSKAITAYYKNEPANAPIITPSTTKLTNQAVKLKADSEEKSTISYSFDGINYETYLDELAVAINQKVYFKSQDVYGNESEIVTFDVTNIQADIAAKPVISMTSKVRTATLVPPVQITIAYDTELTKEQSDFTHLRYSLDSGKTYQNYLKPFELTTSGEIWAQSYDDAGNESEIVKTAVLVSDIKQPPVVSKEEPPIKEEAVVDTTTPDKPNSDKSVIDDKSSTKLEEKQVTVANSNNSNDPSLKQKPLPPVTTSNGKKGQVLPQTGEKKVIEPLVIGLILIVLVSGRIIFKKSK